MQADSTQVIIKKMLTTTPPAFSAAEAVAVAASQYGIHGSVRPLVSERDQNFRLDADDGKRYTLKISNEAEQLQVIDFQNQALCYVEKSDASLPLPRVIPNLHGQLHCGVEKDGKAHFVRVLSWLDGLLLDEAQASAGLANQLGRLLARLGLALEGFDHPGSNPPSLWDMKRAAGLRDLLPYIEEPGLRQLITQTLDRFVSKVEPVLGTLRTQVIHSDMNLGNVLMDEKSPDQISGLIDFGDIVKSPLIIDLAIASAYQLSEGDDPLGGTLPMIAGYHAVRPLQGIEMEVLLDLIRTRLITSVLINSYRVTLFPENREYLMISHQSAISFLTRLQSLGADEALERIHAVCVPA
jgi:hydroxylysine kinase